MHIKMTLKQKQQFAEEYGSTTEVLPKKSIYLLKSIFPPLTEGKYEDYLEIG